MPGNSWCSRADAPLWLQRKVNTPMLASEAVCCHHSWHTWPFPLVSCRYPPWCMWRLMRCATCDPRGCSTSPIYTAPHWNLPPQPQGCPAAGRGDGVFYFNIQVMHRAAATLTEVHIFHPCRLVSREEWSQGAFAFSQGSEVNYSLEIPRNPQI